MSPEQAWGRPVDARSDLFSLGAVLFEMVTGERLFTGDSEISVLESVRQGRTRAPRQVDPTVPREVDEIVARALADRSQGPLPERRRDEAAAGGGPRGALPRDQARPTSPLYIQRVLEPDAAERAEPAAAPPAPSPGRPAAAPRPPRRRGAAAGSPILRPGSRGRQASRRWLPLGEVRGRGGGRAQEPRRCSMPPSRP